MWILACGQRCVVSLMVLVALVMVPARASAEWFIDLYGGYAWTERADVQVKGLDILGVPVDVELLGTWHCSASTASRASRPTSTPAISATRRP